MKPFDPRAYERDVVRPLRGRSGRLPDDLLTRYAVELGCSDAELAQRLTQIRSHWNKSAQSTAKSSFTTSVYQAFLREDEELRRVHGDAMSRMSWWRDRHDDRAGASQQQVDELVKMLTTNFGELGLITPGQLAAMRETFSQLAPAEVDQALAKAGVRTASPLELPTTSGLPDTLFNRLKALLGDAEVTGIPELLHGKLDNFKLLSAFDSTPPFPAGLTAEAVRQAIDRENRRSGNQPAREALGLLNTAVSKDGVDLRLLSLYHLLDDVRRLCENGAPASALLRVLGRSGLDAAEARQAVLSVLGEARAAPAVTGLPKVAELLAAGKLIAAQQALAAITDAEQAAAAKAAVDRHAEQVRELREAAHRAARSGAEGEARRQLGEAARLAVDDDAIAAELRRIPLSPVDAVTAQPDGVGVRVSWRAQPDHDDGTRYRVVRRAGRTPGDADDGDVVAEGGETAVVDSGVAAGIVAGYAVFAAEPGGVWSRPVGATIEVLPPVHGVRLVVRAGAVEGSWQIHRDAVGVAVVRRRDGESSDVPVPTNGDTSFRDSTVDLDGDCTYLLTARYRRPDGTEVAADAVPVRHTSRVAATLPPVTALDARRFGGELMLSWVWPDDVRMAEVSWTHTAAGVETGRLRLTRQQYQADGGCRIDAGPGTVRVQVSAIATADNGESRSAPSALHLAGTPPQVSYQVERQNRLFGTSTARIVLTADQPVSECTVLVVVAPGRVMPLKPDDGRVVHRDVHELGEPLELNVELPRRKPFWLRCFVEAAGVQLIDPPISQLKVS
ncbi:hypothetical protein MOQ72_01930 [Saccharopolyspora sp. K220]|uniref:hypothetical protein n=1 Tax=Saccharopolyspora soli TaxID=2926618 RepID=UPI001F5AD22C|nr:hypothetical protein [Saccharopolyspora soli]MCI2416169.1 hypothetical protein [Saccharopolyspora soli]